MAWNGGYVYFPRVTERVFMAPMGTRQDMLRSQELAAQVAATQLASTAP